MDATEQIRQVVGAWPDVTEGPARFGGVGFRVNGQEIGHLHAGIVADFRFPAAIGALLVREGKARPHHTVRDSGAVSLPIHDRDAIADALALFCLAYDLAVASRGACDHATGGERQIDNG